VAWKKTIRINHWQAVFRCKADDQILMKRNCYLGYTKQSAVGLTREMVDGALDLRSVAHSHANRPDPNRRRKAFEPMPEIFYKWFGLGIKQKRSLALAALAVTPQIRSLAEQKRTSPGHLESVVRDRSDTSRPSIAALRKVYSITSSAMKSTPGGTSMSSDRVVSWSKTNSNLVEYRQDFPDVLGFA
jgi:hypothetical protein